MLIRRVGVFMAAVCIGLCGASGSAQAAEKKLISFSMEDQFSKKFTHKDLAGKLILMMASDKGGSGYSEEWALGIQKRLKEIENTKPVKVVANLQLTDVPELLRGAIKRLMPRDKETRILLDWEGAFTKPYGLKKGKCNILVFSKSGDLIYQTALTKYKSSKAGEIATSIAKEQRKD